jgi:hypothetical protein
MVVQFKVSIPGSRSSYATPNTQKDGKVQRCKQNQPEVQLKSNERTQERAVDKKGVGDKLEVGVTAKCHFLLWSTWGRS